MKPHSLLLLLLTTILPLPLTHAQQTLYLADFPGYSALASCAFTAVSYASSSLNSDCDEAAKPTAFASCACLKNQNSAYISQVIVSKVKVWCGSLKTDDISSATAVWTSYCAPALPASAAATTTTQAPAVITTLPALTQITAAATLAGCAATGLSYAINSITSAVPPLAGPEQQASCACLKNQNSLFLSQAIISKVGAYCSSTATEDITSALAVFGAYCSLGAAKAVTTFFDPVITSIGPMSAIQYLTSLAPCASSAFSNAVNSLTYSECSGVFQPAAFATCACANATVSEEFSVRLVTGVNYRCSSTATEDITSALAVFSSFCVLAGGASGPATAATTGLGGVTCKFQMPNFGSAFVDLLIRWSCQDVGTSATTTYGVTRTPTPTNTDAGAAGGGSAGGGFSQSDKIALGCGIGIGLPATLASIIGVWMKCARRRSDGVHPAPHYGVPYNYGPSY
ncbi:hypothetical protein MMC30_003662 [Trapelia coarctata]|nr:hypothetical protein [Trapelia coarctata]